MIATDGENLYFQDYGVVGVPIAGGPQFDVDDTDYVYAMAADHGGLFWVGLVGSYSPEGVYAVPTGAPAPERVATLGTVGETIAVDSGWIYYVSMESAQSILRIPRGGGTIQTVVASGWASVMATDGAFLYWADGIPEHNPAKIHKTPVGGGADEVIAQADGYVGSMVIDAECVYFTDDHGTAIKSLAR